MSTTALKEALDLLAEDPGENYATLVAARDELEAIRKAARDIAACRSAPYTPTSVRGRRWYPAMEVIHAIAKEEPHGR